MRLMSVPRHILIVEDSADDAELAARALRRGGCELTYERVETPQAMHAALARAKWDLVIADYSMPHFNGLAALKLLQEQGLDLPFILVSGAVGEDAAVQAMKAGAHDYVLKNNLARLPPAVERELREAEVRRERRRAESRYRNLFDSVPVGVFITTPEGRVLETNPTFVEMLGFEDAESLKRVNIAELCVHPEERARLTALIASEGVVRNFEMQLQRRDAGPIWCAESARAVYDATGKVDHYEEVSVDVTARKHVEEEISSARSLALEAIRVRSEFLTSMSHEVRTPLNAIVGLTELLLLSELSPAQHRQADQIRSSGELLLTIVKDILDFSKLAAGKVVLEEVRFSLDHLVEETIHDFVAPAAHKGIELALFVAPGITGGLRGDPNRLRQILNNLLSNAVKFTDHGEVSLSVAKLQDIDNELLLSFEVRDSGIGIPHEVQERLFQPFVQADSSTARKYGGTGLGLVIAASLVKQMGGEIGFESESATGSIFHFTARFERCTAPGDVTKLMLREDSFAGTRAMIVTPSATNRRMLSEYLSRWGISNMSMNTAASALKELREATARGDPFHLALVEATLAEVGGPTLVEEIKRDPALAEIKVLAIGTSAGGADAVISKPIRLSHLLNCLMALLRGNRPVAHQAVAQGKSAMVVDDNSAARKSVHVLVVDDNLVNSSLARTQLERLGYSTEIAHDGYGALEAVALRRYDIILMDCEMPGMDGYTATAEIRQREHPGRRAAIVAMTAHAMAGMRARCLAAGMDDYLAKPVKLLPLAATLDRWAFGEFAGKQIAAPAAAPLAEPDDSYQAKDFDLSTIRELRSLSNVTTEDVFLDLVEVYRSELSAVVAALQSAVADRDVEAIHKVAHALKGSSLTLGAARFGALCEGVQKSAEGPKIEETIICTNELIAQAAGLPELLKRAGVAAAL
jgi:PAS domain S-box-containing protein